MFRQCLKQRKIEERQPWFQCVDDGKTIILFEKQKKVLMGGAGMGLLLFVMRLLHSGHNVIAGVTNEKCGIFIDFATIMRQPTMLL